MHASDTKGDGARTGTGSEQHVLSPCPICDTDETHFIVSFSMPIDTNRLWPSEQEARSAPWGELHLRYCADCGHLYNAAYDDELVDYEHDYENSQMFSERFRSYVDELADHLTASYALRDRPVVEIGGGRGEFLAVLCERAGCYGVSFGPSFLPQANERLPVGVTIVTDRYTERYANLRSDLFICRHVLEHIGDPNALLSTVRRAVGERDVPIYFEVPNAEYMVEHDAVYELIYTHPSYYTRASLERLFRYNGFSPTGFREAFAGQFLAIEGRVRDGGAGEALPLSPERIARFGRSWEQLRHEWWERLTARLGRRIAVWGAGAKAVHFLNHFVPSPAEIAYVVDVNPIKNGTFIPGTGHRIVDPDRARSELPDVVIVMNRIYREEIEAELRTATGAIEYLIA